jgi:CHAT domain-containing protein/tetratricopeptide (TPR) repeat protein
VEGKVGADTLALARALDLLVEAQLKNGRADTLATLNLAERVVRLKEQHLGRAHPELAISLHNLGTAHARRGEFSVAVRLHERGLMVRSAAAQADDPGVADSLDQLALALIHLEKFSEAKRSLDQSRRIREIRSIESPLALAGTLELVGMLERYSGDYPAAVAPTERALEIRSRLAPDHPDGVLTLELRGDIFLLTGDIDSAQRTWSSALALGERTLGPDHSTIVQVLRRLGFAAFAQGNLSESRQRDERALRIAESVLAPCDPELVRVLLGLANSLASGGDYSRAQKLYERGLATIQKCKRTGADVSTDDHATTVYNMAMLARDLGDLAEADRLYVSAVQIWSNGLGPNHPFVAHGLDALSEVVAARGQLDRAQALHQRALAIRRSRLGPEHPLVGWTLTSLAGTVADMGDLSRAVRYTDQAIAIYKKSGSSDEPDHFARVLELRGTLETRLGNFEAARASLTEALAERERIFGATHPLAAETRTALARVDFARGAFVVALAAALDAEQAGRDHLRFTVRYLPERQAMLFAVERPRGLDLALSIVAAGRVADASPIFESVVQSRGVILDELAARARLTTADPASSALNATLVSSRQRFANLMLRSLQGRDVVPRELLDQARQQKEDAERAMAERSAGARADLERARVGLDDVRGALPEGSALVSFVRYDRTVISKVGERTAIRTVPSYIAFVMRSDSSAVAAIPLGAAMTIDEAVNAWREQAAGRRLGESGDAGAAEGAYRKAGTALRRQIWDPVAAHLGAATLVLIAPDGALNLVGFATLPSGASGYLVEQPRTIHYVSTERDLIPTERAASTAGLLAVGGASFDLRPAQSQSAPRPAVGVLRSGCGSLKSAHFDDLPGTREEVADIARVWRRGGFAQSMILTGRGATETAVKRAVVGRQVVHLATHGFFLGSDCDGAPAGTRAVGGLTSSRSGAPEQTENPLLLSGLALSGANNHIAATSPADDGILTAEEVASLNLQRTDWVVLSACDTGIGEVRPGEGVFGLRRAFQIAGARTVIMSLWSIDDQAAREWMRALYQDHFERHLNTAEAMREASLSVLRARRARGESTHPFYWGAFVAVGDWR